MRNFRDHGMALRPVGRMSVGSYRNGRQLVAINPHTPGRPMPALLSPERPARDPLTADDLSGLRLVPVPDVGPPFDGEILADAAASVAAGQISLGPDAHAASRNPMASMDGLGPGEGPGEWPQQFARLLAEALAGARPVRQILPWTSDRARGHLHKLMPLFGGGQRPRVQRVIATRPTREVIEMTVIVSVSTRTRALAIRLEHMAPRRQLARHADRAADSTQPALRWVCTDIEAA
jgi:hypothetical protein